jgi:outer membrane protein insertion porin family
MGKIRELYRKDGFYNAKVDYKLDQADAKRARLNIVVDEGKKLYVTDIVIQGAKQLDLQISRTNWPCPNVACFPG